MARFAWMALALMAAAGCSDKPATKNPDKTEGEEFQPLLTIPGYTHEQDDPLAEEIEIAYLAFNAKGDAARRVSRDGSLGSEGPQRQYLLLYSNGWMKHKTFGGPFEGLARRSDVDTYWKEVKKLAYQDLYKFLWDRGFFSLPGDDTVDWSRFEGKDVFTKAISVQRGDDRWIVFLDDVTGARGDDPRWNVFRDCELKILSWFTAIDDVRPQVQKQGFKRAFEEFLNPKEPK